MSTQPPINPPFYIGNYDAVRNVINKIKEDSKLYIDFQEHRRRVGQDALKKDIFTFLYSGYIPFDSPPFYLDLIDLAREHSAVGLWETMAYIVYYFTIEGSFDTNDEELRRRLAPETFLKTYEQTIIIDQIRPAKPKHLPFVSAYLGLPATEREKLGSYMSRMIADPKTSADIKKSIQCLGDDEMHHTQDNMDYLLNGGLPSGRGYTEAAVIAEGFGKELFGQQEPVRTFRRRLVFAMITWFAYEAPDALWPSARTTFYNEDIYLFPGLCPPKVQFECDPWVANAAKCAVASSQLFEPTLELFRGLKTVYVESIGKCWTTEQVKEICEEMRKGFTSPHGQDADFLAKCARGLFDRHVNTPSNYDESDKLFVANQVTGDVLQRLLLTGPDALYHNDKKEISMDIRNSAAAQDIFNDLRGRYQFVGDARALVHDIYGEIGGTATSTVIARLRRGDEAEMRQYSYDANDWLNQLARLTYNHGYKHLYGETQIRRALLALLLEHFNPNNVGVVAVDECACTTYADPFASYNNTTAPEGTMNCNSTPIKVEEITYVTLPGGSPAPAKSYSDDQLVCAISESEKRVEELSKVKTESSAVKAKIAELEAGAVAIAAILDARAEKK
jgi:hypothetical protein